MNLEKLEIKLPDGIIKKTISRGISEFPGNTVTLRSCIEYADLALFRAKEEGGSRSVRFAGEIWQEEQVGRDLSAIGFNGVSAPKQKLQPITHKGGSYVLITGY